MRENLRLKRRAALWLFFLLAVPAIDQGFGASFRDGDKGQPEMVQPLDNHPMEWTVNEQDEAGAAAAGYSYRYHLMQRTNSLITEALAMLGRVRDTRSRRWLEAFVYKMGELAVQLGGKQYQRKAEMSTSVPLQVVPMTHPSTTTVASVRYEKTGVENQVTSTHLNHVLPVNEVMMNPQVVTKPGVAETPFEDELVRQLHDQERLSKQEAQNKIKAANSSSYGSSQLPESVQDDISNLAVKDDEKQLLMDLAKELNELSDLDGDEKQIKRSHKTTELKVSQPNGQRSSVDKENDVDGGDHGAVVEYSSYGEAQNSGFYFPSASASPKKLQDNIPSIGKNEKSPSQHSTEPKIHTEKQNQSSQHLTHPNWDLPQATTARSFVTMPPYQKFQPARYIPNNNMHNTNFNRPKEMTLSMQGGRFKNPNMAPHDYPMQDQPVKVFHNPQNKPRHPILQEMLLASHGYASPYMHSGSPRMVMATRNGQPTKVFYNQTNAKYPSSQNGNYAARDFKQQPGINPKQRISQPQLQPVNQGLNFGAVSGENMNSQQSAQWNGVPRAKSISNFHFDRVSFPNQLGVNPQLQHNMERQLRAGKVVILSDSLVKTNFNKSTTQASPPIGEVGQITAQAQDALKYKKDRN